MQLKDEVRSLRRSDDTQRNDGVSGANRKARMPNSETEDRRGTAGEVSNSSARLRGSTAEDAVFEAEELTARRDRRRKMARFSIEVDAPKPRVVEVSTIQGLDAKVAEMVATIERAAVSQIPLDAAAEKMLAIDAHVCEQQKLRATLEISEADLLDVVRSLNLPHRFSRNGNLFLNHGTLELLVHVARRLKLATDAVAG